MKYKVRLEKPVFASFIVEADDADDAVKLAEDQAREHPEEFDDGLDSCFYLCAQWDIDEDGNEIQIY